MAKRERITETDAIYLGFLAHFPGADTEALSYLTTAQENPFGAEVGKLTSPLSVLRRMQKLQRMGAIQRYTNPITGMSHYGILDLGIEAASIYGYDTAHARGIDGLSLARLNHYQKIALVAAQFASPVGVFRDSLGIEPVAIDQLVSENTMRAHYEYVHQMVKSQRANGAGDGEFSTQRLNTLKKASEQVQKGELDPSQMLTMFPMLWTVANSRAEVESRRVKALHQPDLAIRLDDHSRTNASPKAQNLLVEVELSAKTPADYEAILKTLHKELKLNAVYKRAIYFVGSKAISNAIERADRAAESNLIGSGRLMILPITGRDGKKRGKETSRVSKPKQQEPVTVPAPPKPRTVEADMELPDLEDLAPAEAPKLNLKHRS